MTPKRCNCCGQLYRSWLDWERAPFVGVSTVEGVTHEYRNCRGTRDDGSPCGTTLVIELPDPPRPPSCDLFEAAEDIGSILAAPQAEQQTRFLELRKRLNRFAVGQQLDELARSIDPERPIPFTLAEPPGKAAE